ncbi:MAG: rRNA maturation RNase YbeY [Candidatus Gastranaerophilales bacterium]|nr:rRNA maturation RNase YbeY [Candidatus Gastranaerophilales bacterium]
MTNCCVTVSNEQDEFPIDEAKFEKIGSKMLHYLLNKSQIINLSELNEYNLSNITLDADILITNDKEIKKLNLKYRNINKPTDVLSFAIFADNPENRIIFENNITLGDIVISAQTAKQQADENNKSFEEEIVFLLSHGLLHLLGFDHKNDDELNFMLKVQNEIIEFAVK